MIDPIARGDPAEFFTERPATVRKIFNAIGVGRQVTIRSHDGATHGYVVLTPREAEHLRDILVTSAEGVETAAKQMGVTL